MTSSYSTDLKLELMVTGENAGTWGDKTNTNLNLLQQAIAGYQAVSIAGGAQTTALVMSNASISNARNAVVKLTGTITGNQIVTIPDGIEKTYIVENGTTGAFTVEFKTVSGTGPTFSTTDKGIKIVYSDGTNIVDVNANLSGPTLASDLNVNGKSIISTSNGNIVLAPNGTGDVQLDADTVRIGDSNANATLTTNGTGDLILNTNSGSNSGSITIADAANGNISITPNGTGSVVLDGLNWPQADGSNGQVLQTNGSGQLSFASASGGNFKYPANLDTGVSTTANRVVNYTTTGNKIIAYPSLNTMGTERTNSSTSAYSAVSSDGTRAISVGSSFSSNDTGVLTMNGRAISSSANPTNGTASTQTFSVSNARVNNNVNWIAQAFPAGANKFLIFYGGNLNSCGQIGLQTYVMAVTVDSSGNITKGTPVTLNNDGATCTTGSITFQVGKITNNIFAYNGQRASSGAIQRTVTSADGSTTVTATADTDAPSFTSSTDFNTVYTTNNIIGLGFDNSWRTASYTSGNIGTASTATSQIADYSSSATWYKISNGYVMVNYINTSSVRTWRVFSINQTTGALTSVYTATDPYDGNLNALTFKSESEGVGRNGSVMVSISLSSGSIVGFNNNSNPATFFPSGFSFNNVIRYISSNDFRVFYTLSTNFPSNKEFTVVAYAGSTFTYGGFAETTESSGRVNRVADGTFDGFTGLTEGLYYYISNNADGTVTSTSANAYSLYTNPVGYALSTTLMEIL